MDDSNDLVGLGADSTAELLHVRPTLRCLVDDLQPDLKPSELQQALQTARSDIDDDPTFLLPVLLRQAKHPVLSKADEVAADNGNTPKIRSITDKHVYRIKTSARRGALWEDGTGQWWLLAAGRRRDDGSADFYKQLNRLVGDAASIFPTDLDYRYLALESAYRDECQVDRRSHEVVIRALLGAAHRQGTAVVAEVFGAQIAIRVKPDEGDVAVLEVSWKMKSFEEQGRFPADVLGMIPASTHIDEWRYQSPPVGSGLDQRWWTYVSQSWIDSFAIAAELDDLIGASQEAPPVDPVTDGSEDLSHWARGSVVTRSYIEGIEIVGLCGARIVAHRDFEGFPVCPKCQQVVELLRKLQPPSPEWQRSPAP